MRGETDLLFKTRRFSETRFGKPEAQEMSFVHAGAGLAQGEDFSVTLTHTNLTKSLNPPPPHLPENAGRPNGSPVEG